MSEPTINRNTQRRIVDDLSREVMDYLDNSAHMRSVLTYLEMCKVADRLDEEGSSLYAEPEFDQQYSQPYFERLVTDSFFEEDDLKLSVIQVILTGFKRKGLEWMLSAILKKSETDNLWDIELCKYLDGMTKAGVDKHGWTLIDMKMRSKTERGYTPVEGYILDRIRNT